MAVAIVLAGCSAQIDLYSGLSDAEANEVVGALGDNGIKAVKHPSKNGLNVSVPEAELARSNSVLTSKGLPRRPAARLGDVFKKEGLISSPLEERARYIYALSQELETTIAQIDGVVVARVHVVLPEKVAPGEPVQPPSAAVFIKHMPSLEPDIVSYRVRQLVARSIPGMGQQALDRVSAVFVAAEPLPQRPPLPPDHTSQLWALLALAIAGAVGGLLLYGRTRGWIRWPGTTTPAGAASASTNAASNERAVPPPAPTSSASPA